MKITKKLTALLICAIILFLPSCKSMGSLTRGGGELKIGVNGIEGNFNPFYSESEGDREIVSQMFRTIQRRENDNKLSNYSGGISYEFVGDSKVKYTVSIKDDMYFSDGSNITIDDVIFFYYFISDASYDGIYKDWYLNDIVGLKEYYFDDKNYINSIAQIENTIEEKYTVTTIGVEDYSKYLVETELEGKFAGIDEKSPSGVSWREYLQKLGYGKELEALGANPAKEAALKLAARAEAENNPLAYNPESWYRELLYSNYIKNNYSDGADVSGIEGIKKVNDYTCTVLFNSRNINMISELNVPIVSKNYYSSEYVKGAADMVKNLQGFAVCSGPYMAPDFDDGAVSMAANDFYSDSKCEFRSLKFIDLAAENADPVESVLSGETDVVKTLATSSVISDLNDKSVRYFITNADSYTTMFFNTRTLEASARKALMGLCSVSETLDKKIGSYYTRLFSPISVRFAEYPSSITEPYYNESAYTAYELVSDNMIKSVKAYYCGSEEDLAYAVLSAYKDKLSSKGITLEIVITDESGLENAIISGEADIWIENIPDGATCDKYDYYNSNGSLNKTALKNPDIDTLTHSIRAAVGFSDKAQMTASLMKLVMEQAVELPLFQLQQITIYNTETVNPESFSEEINFDGFTYALPILKKN